jgi:L-histidine N-alpha-methyltransferase
MTDQIDRCDSLNGSPELAEILSGLSSPQKCISPKYFYDERGSRLFDRICNLPEYYLTRTEIGIMRRHAGDMASVIGPGASVIEFGIGSGLKTKLLLDALHDPVAFVPVDISAEHLAGTADELAIEFPDIEMLPVTADFTQPFSVPVPSREAERHLVYFPGSTIGNFENGQAVELLDVMRRQAGDGGALLIGLDLKKESKVIENAYNDSENITAEFNLNVLHHLNRAFGADFDPDAFSHEAVYDENAGRVEMRLVSESDQQVSLGSRDIEFETGEPIVTEYSHKYDKEAFMEMAGEAGFRLNRDWQDSNRWFCIQLYDCC